MKVALGVLVALIALPGVTEGQPSTSAHALRVPAGLKAFACGAGLPASLPAVRLLPALARRDTSMPAGTPESLRASEYLRWLGELQSRVRATGSVRDLVFRLGARRERNAVGDVVEWLGFRLSTGNGTYAISERAEPESLRRQSFASCVGVSPDVLTTALRRQEPARLWPDDETAPSPVPVSVWLSLPAFAKRDANDLFAAIAGDRRALLMYHGFMGLDDETLAGIVADPQLLRALYEDRAAPFAAFGHALKIRGGVLAVPGGDAQRGRWATLVERDPAGAGDFVARLLGRDDGVLADFFSTLHALPESTQAAVVGGADFGALYEVFKNASSTWKIQDNPFSRPASDPGFVLLMLLGDGTPPDAGPGWRRVWQAAFEERSPDLTQSDLTRHFARGERANLAWLLSAITTDASTLDRRLQVARFARRVFGSNADAGHAAVALGGFQRFSVLLLELERAGVRSPATFARAAARARRLSDTEPQRGALTMVSWQAAVAIVAALATSGAVPAESVNALFDELSALPTGRDGLWDGALARFVRDRILPFTGAPPPAGVTRALEDQLLEALARTRGLTDTTFTWEGLEYRTSVTEARAARSQAIAHAQSRLSLDDLLALVTAAESLRGARTAAQVRAAMAPLDGIEKRLPVEVPWLFDTDERPLKPVSFIERQLRDTRRITKDGDAGRARRAADRMVWLVDLLTADTLGAVIYAARFGVGLQTPSLIAGVWRRHEFGMRVPEGAADPDLAWRAPRIGALPDGGWHMRGALIGLDLALGESWLRRLTGGPAPAPTRMADPDQQVLFRSQALLTISPPVKLAAPMPLGSTLNSEPRRQRVLSWLRQADAPHVAPLAWRDTAETPVSDWGTAPEDESCLCRLSYLRRPADAWLGRPLRPTVVPLVPDLSLRVVAMAAQLGLPPILVPALLAAAQQELLDGAELAFKDDWESLATFANALTRERFEEYVFALIATRELTPVQKRP